MIRIGMGVTVTRRIGRTRTGTMVTAMRRTGRMKTRPPAVLILSVY